MSREIKGSMRMTSHHVKNTNRQKLQKNNQIEILGLKL